MAALQKIIYVLFIMLISASFSACSQNTYGHKRNTRHVSASHIDPVSRKQEPLRKTFIVPVKRKRVLGLEKPKI